MLGFLIGCRQMPVNHSKQTCLLAVKTTVECLSGYICFTADIRNGYFVIWSFLQFC